VSFELFQPIDWDVFFNCLLQGTAVGMIVAVYCYLMLSWVIRGKDREKDSRET
jgi:hypothetical protein